MKCSWLMSMAVGTAAVAGLAVTTSQPARAWNFLTPRNIVCGTVGCPSTPGSIVCATGKLSLTVEKMATIEYSVPCYFSDPGQTSADEYEM